MKIKIGPQRITKIKLFIDKYNWEKINYPSEEDYWKKCEKNKLMIAVNPNLGGLFRNSF